MCKNQLTLGVIAQIAGATVEGDPSTPVLGLSPLDEAGPGDLSFFDGRQKAELLAVTQAAGVLVDWRELPVVPKVSLLRCDAPHQAFRSIAAHLWTQEALPPAGIDPTAIVASGAVLGRGCHVGPRAVIGDGATLGEGAVVLAGCVVGPRARIGAGTTLGVNCLIAGGVEIGAQCTILPGVVIGAAYRPSLPGADDDQCPATGGVRIGDGVQIGANSVIEPGETRATRIASGVRIGSACVIGHDSRIGRGAIIGGACGLAGDVEIGAYAVLFGQVGVSSRAKVGDFSTVLAKSGVSRDVPERSVYAGIPARPRRAWQLATNAMYHLPDLRQRVAEMEAVIASLQAAMDAPPVPLAPADESLPRPDPQHPA